jgi:putative DNA methylase
MNDKRLIEVAFPLRQASIDSVHEKNVRHGHISTLHIWPARRPLAASRAALIATLLPDPGDKEKRDEILKRLGGTLKKTTKKKRLPNGRVEEIDAWETVGGILHWGRESGPDLDWFREEIRRVYGGRAPKVLDPFAGGGAIPLEAMRLGCEVTAVDINPVAWFILKCTLEYPQNLAGKTRRLPDFALQDREFMAAYFKAEGLTPAEIKRHLRDLPYPSANVGRVRPTGRNPTNQASGYASLSRPTGGEGIERGENFDLFDHPDLDPELLQADLAWHVRAWGHWVLKEARKELARFYPTYAEFCTVKPYRVVPLDSEERLKLVPMNEAGEPQVDLLNAGFDEGYLENPANPRWVAKPTVAYLWARTVRCKACRATVPLLKTRWLAKKESKRVLLTMRPLVDKTGVVFGIDPDVKVKGGNPAQRREHDKKIGAGTMSRAGVTCPCCGTIMTMEDLRLEGRAGRLGAVMTAVVMDSPNGKEYRLPTVQEVEMAQAAEAKLDNVFADVPFGLPTEPTPKGGSGASRAFSVDGYGLDQWRKLFTPRQLVGIAGLLKGTRRLQAEFDNHAYPRHVSEAIAAVIATVLDRIADRGSSLCSWTVGWDKIRNTFVRFALPMSWDFAETSVLADASGGYPGGIEWLAQYIEHAAKFAKDAPGPTVVRKSATQAVSGTFDVVVTDPPYYDAIPYSDLMDFFYVWLRRTLKGLSADIDEAFAEPLGPKWNHDANDGELIDDAARFGGDRKASKRNYEAGMARAFAACHTALRPEGRLVIVFAHKHPDAWETLVGAIIKAGFVVDGSWPIQTEREARTRSLSSAALSSSVWLVCRKRDPMVRAGWDTQVLKEMESNIVQRLRDFWDAGIRGPDFVWAATGPALEAYSRYPAVKKASEPGALMGVDEFLRHVRRIVVDFVVGRVLTHGEAEAAVGDHPLDDVTTYYLLHRNDFGLKEAPAGPCILYMVSCGLPERDLVDQYDLLARGSKSEPEAADNEADEDTDEEEADASTSGGGGKFKLKPWSARRHRSLGEDTTGGRPAPLIDQVHKLMHLWKAGDVGKVNDYLDRRGLRHSHIFAQLIQALIEKSRAEGQNDECSILERLANHLRTVGSASQMELSLGG